MSERHNQNGASREVAHFPEELLTAYALGQLEGAERGEIERLLANPAQGDARRIVAQTQRLADELPAAIAASSEEPANPSSADLRALVEQHLQSTPEVKVELPAKRRPWYRLTLVEAGVVVSICCLLAAILWPTVFAMRNAARRVASGNHVKQLDPNRHRETAPSGVITTGAVNAERGSYPYGDMPLTTLAPPDVADPASSPGQPWFDKRIHEQTERLTGEIAGDVDSAAVQVELQKLTEESAPKNDLLATVGAYSGSGVSGRGAPMRGKMVAATGGSSAKDAEEVRNRGSQGQTAGQDRIITQSVQMAVTPRIIIQEEEEGQLVTVTEPGQTKSFQKRTTRGHSFQIDSFGTEQYEPIHENAFLAPRQNPLSTFSIDVDTASYANVRRFLTGGSLPPPSAVRIEELVNYFRYDYPQPKGPEPFSVNMEVAECPWAESHLLLRVGLKGKDVHRGERPASNLVFLLDVSGSMADENKLPLLKTAMQMFTRELGENDRVSIVTYAGEAGLRLPPTRGHEQEKILAAIESLSSGGSTNGSAGIDLAYEQAKAYFVEGGTNRVILCTDGDLNVGITDDEALVQLIKQKAGGGTFLTVLGFGEGNLKDAKMEKLADNGNGLYAYIDSVREARKVLVEQMTGSTITIAKDVKIQIEFNPAVIASYRLLGYENRVLAAQDFNDDKKDAGEIGAGHTVTALYELAPVGVKADAAVPAAVEPLKYQAAGGEKSEVRGQEESPLTDAAKSGELLTLKLRYKEPEGQASKLLEVPLKDRGGKFNGASKDLQFAAAVASFGMILRGSEHKGSSTIAAVEEIASGAIGEDAGGYRAEFVDLVRKAHSLGAR